MNSMSLFSLALLLGTAMYSIRISGLLLADSPLPPVLLRVLRYAPVALLGALAAPGLFRGGAAVESAPRLVALLFAALLARWSKRIDIAVIGGLALYGIMVALS